MSTERHSTTIGHGVIPSASPVVAEGGGRKRWDGGGGGGEEGAALCWVLPTAPPSRLSLPPTAAGRSSVPIDNGPPPHLGPIPSR